MQETVDLMSNETPDFVPPSLCHWILQT